MKAIFESFFSFLILVSSFPPHSQMVMYDIFVISSRIFFFASEFYFAFEGLVIFA